MVVSSKTRKVLWIALAGLLVAGCAGMDPEDFAGTGPELRLEDYFAGRSVAYGIFEDRFGTLRREFKVVIDGRMDGDTLVLDEDFFYADGERDRRVWRIRRTGQNTYEGRADDIVGVARGTAYGKALNWRYKMDLAVGEDTWRVGFDDWMFLQADGVLINRAQVTRWGIEIGSVTITFFRPETATVIAGTETP